MTTFRSRRFTGLMDWGRNERRTILRRTVDRRILGIRYADEVRPCGDKVTIEILPRRELIVRYDKALGEPGMERVRFARVVNIGPKVHLDDADGRDCKPGDLLMVGIFCGEDINGTANKPGWNQYWMTDPHSDARIMRDKEAIAVVDDIEDRTTLNGYKVRG